MNIRNPNPSPDRRHASVSSLLAGFVATMFALPVQAGIAIPNTPLMAGANVPPNIMFILDTSGSMDQADLINPSISVAGGGLTQSNLGFTENVPATGASWFVPQVYTSNSLYYNPNISYTPWRRDYGTLVTNTPYSAVYTHRGLASGTTTNLQSSVQTFYAPKPTNTNLSDLLQYYRYQILTTGRVVRSERLQGQLIEEESTPLNVTNLTTTAVSQWATAGGVSEWTVVVPDEAVRLIVSTVGTDQDADLYVRSGQSPTTSNSINCGKTNANNSNETCTINDPNTATYYIRVRSRGESNSQFSGVTLTAVIETETDNNGVSNVGCDTNTSGWGWRNCTFATPTGRSEADERQNFATWYSFHRTRMKSAKAGMGTAFSDMGEEFRVGVASLTDLVSPIPVETDGGLFRNKTTAPTSTNRSDWFTSVFNMSSNGYTPLREALTRVGEYYKESGADGPYGGTGASQLACRQNFSILTTDGYWNNNGGGSLPSGLSGDEDAGTTITGPNSASYTYASVAPYRAIQENTLADVAMHYWKQDLRPTLDNIVPTSTANPAFWQHMVTFGISLGLKGDLDPDTDLPAITAGTKSWGNISSFGNTQEASKIDDLWHAAVNSRGSFAAATDPAAFAEAIRGALAAVVERTSSGSNVSANSTSITSSALLFQARYVSGRWYGDLNAYAITASGASETAAWTASAQLPAPGSRNILTWNGTGGAAFPTGAQSTALNTPTAGVSDYIRGVRTLEESQGTGTFRNRNHPLGDIIHSSPMYDKETNTVYVGANDGMLHAFNASTGAERFAYIPGNIDLANLESLASKNYAHAYFVDGPVAISTRKQTPGKSYLVGSLGRGGKGVFGLDVTTPGAMTNTDVLWDYDATNHGKMGMVISRPLIAQLNDGSVGVIVANGPNSTDDTAVLYVLDVTNGAVLAEIDTGTATGYGGATAPNGLSGPRGWDVDGNGTVDYVYAGDLRGNMWKFDLTATTAATWDDADQRSILFTAVDSDGKRQPISGTPAVSIDPLTYKTWVFFGTGRYLNTDDVKDAAENPNLDVQTWYGLADDGAAITGRDQLQQRRIVATGSIAGRPVRAFEAPSELDTTKKGWYIDLVAPPNPPGTPQGERMIGESAIVGATLLASSIIPTATACDPGGTGYINALNAFTGTSNAPNFFDVDGDGSFSDDTITSGGAQLAVGSVNLGLGMPTDAIIAGTRLEQGGSTAAKGGINVNLSEIYGRKSWREVIGD